jgi:hypothetical protein
MRRYPWGYEVDIRDSNVCMKWQPTMEDLGITSEIVEQCRKYAEARWRNLDWSVYSQSYEERARRARKRQGLCALVRREKQRVEEEGGGWTVVG